VYPELRALIGPTVPDLRGMFLRGHGSQSHTQNNGSIVGVTSTLHQSAALGQIQGEAARRIQGSIYNFGGMTIGTGGAIGQVVYSGPQISAGVVTGSAVHFAFDSARVVPTAPENRPVNQAVRYLIRAAL